MSLITSKTSLKGLKYSDFKQSQKLESPTDLKAFSNTDAPVGQHKSPDTKTGLGLEVEKRKEDVIRLTRATANSPQAIRFQTNQTLLNQQALVGQLKFDPKQVAIGAARVAGVTASAIAQAAGSGTGLRVLQGFVPLNGGYVVDKGRGSLLGAAIASLNPFATENQISKANIALRGKKIDDEFIQTGFERDAVGFNAEALTSEVRGIRLNRTSVPRPEDRTQEPSVVGLKEGTYVGSEFASFKPTFGEKIQISDQKVLSEYNLPIGSLRARKPETLIIQDSEDLPRGGGELERKINDQSYIRKRSTPAIDGDKGPGKFIKQTTAVDKIRRKGGIPAGTKSLESRFYVNGTTSERDQINFLNISTSEIAKKDQDIIPFTIQNLPANTTNSEFLYFRAYLDSLSDSYNGEWSGTRYIGRGEELYNYTGFKRGLQFSFKIAAHSAQELKPLYEKLNRLAGTTAPTYQDGLFMQGVFSKITIGDYVQKLPGFFTSVDLTWQTAYPWEIGDVDDGSALDDIPRVPHILDVSVSFQPVHDFAPQYGQNFIVNTAAS